MYTLCPLLTLKESYNTFDKAVKQNDTQTSSSASAMPWTAVRLDDKDPSRIVAEFTVPYDPQEKNVKAQKGETVRPVSAETAAAISFPSLESRRQGKTLGAEALDLQRKETVEGGQWHYRYRINKRGRCVVETNGDAYSVSYWQSFFGGDDDGGAAETENSAAGPSQSAAINVSNKGMQRELVVFYKGGSGGGSQLPVGAVDLNCYHIGYPIDLGDIEDIHVCSVKGGMSAKEDSDADDNSREASVASAAANVASSSVITTINCPLHNRIFDVQTGDMIRMDYSNAFSSCLLPTSDSDADEAMAKLFKVTSGKWKGGVVQRDACRQRVHRCELSRSSDDDQNEKVEPPRIVVFDSFFSKNRAVSSAASSQSHGGSWHHAAVNATTFASDKYNVWGDTSIARK